MTEILNPDVESNEEKLTKLTNAATWVPPEEAQMNEGEQFFNQTYVRKYICLADQCL